MYWIGQEVHLDFLMEKPKWTFLPNQEFPGSDKILSLSLFTSLFLFNLESPHMPLTHIVICSAFSRVLWFMFSCICIKKGGSLSTNWAAVQCLESLGHDQGKGQNVEIKANQKRGIFQGSNLLPSYRLANWVTGSEEGHAKRMKNPGEKQNPRD